MKRVWATLLTLVMMLSLAAPAGAAEKATATTMRLMETEGTASVENAAGKTLTVTKNMRLYNGYEVSTEAASYAYVSLDSSKAVKLDASSAAEVSKSGRQLELKLTDGKLFFNVPVALEQDESMEIRTSTMMMGVRGTSGWVSVLDRYTTRIGILEGMVTIYSQDPITGADRSVTITGGQTATIIRHERAQAMEQELIRQGVIIEANIVEELTELGQVVEELREDGVPGFAAAEVAKDSDLQDRINKESPLDADLIAQNAAQKLAADEAAAALKEAQQEAAQQPWDDTTPASTKNLFAETKTVVVTETVVIERPSAGTTEYVSSVLDRPNYDTVKTVLSELGTVVIKDASNVNLIQLSNEMEANDTVYVLDADISNSGTWTVNGTLAFMNDVEIENEGTINVEGTLDIGGGAVLNNTGTINVNSTNSLVLGGILNNDGLIMIGESDSGKMLIKERGVLYNYGNVIVNGEHGQERMVEETDTITGLLINNGSFYNYAQFLNYGTFENAGLFENGEYDEDSGLGRAALSEATNYGVIKNSGSLKNYGYFSNAGTITATGDAEYAFMNCYGGSLYMTTGTISASGNSCALAYDGGYLEVTGGEVVYNGSGNGCALNGIPGGWDGSGSTVVLKAPTNNESLHNLIGGFGSHIAEGGCVRSYDNESFNAICLYNYYEEYSNPYFKARCCPYTDKKTADGYTTYTVSFVRWCYHEGGPA